MFLDSTPGRGTNVQISLPSEPSEARECLPDFNAATLRQYETPAPGAAQEWSEPKKPVEQLVDERQPAGLY